MTVLLVAVVLVVVLVLVIALQCCAWEAPCVGPVLIKATYAPLAVAAVAAVASCGLVCWHGERVLLATCLRMIGTILKLTASAPIDRPLLPTLCVVVVAARV